MDSTSRECIIAEFVPLMKCVENKEHIADQQSYHLVLCREKAMG